MIYYLAALFIIGFSFKSFKRSLFLYVGFKLLLVSNINLISKASLPLLTLELFLDFWFVFLYFFKRDKIPVSKSKFPLKTILILITLSIFTSSCFSLAGFKSEISNLLKFLISELFFVLLLWKLVTSGKDIKFIYKTISFVFFISCIYCFYEFFTKTNPVIEYGISLVQDPSKIVDFRYTADFGRGYRCQSFFEHAMGAGVNRALFAIITFYLYSKVEYIKISFFDILTGILSIVCIFLTRCRTPILLLIIGMISTFTLKNTRGKNVVAFSFLIPIFFIVTLLFIQPNFIFDYLVQLNSGGSSIELRFQQLAKSFFVIKTNPLFGLGSKFMTLNIASLNEGLFGLESVRFSSLTKFGIVGFALQLIFMFLSVFYLPVKYQTKDLFWITVSYWVANTLSSLPGMSMTLYYFLMIIVIKNTSTFKNSFCVSSFHASKLSNEYSRTELANC